jgi:hypothetical protein
MLDRSIPTRKALVHYIPISEVKDMKSDMKASLFEKILWTLFTGSILIIFTKENCVDFEFLSATFPPLGSTFLKSI